ncbi:alkaline phosphatase family protein [Candidatus Babeliales bacterium]|nr:alkaline phosphatase family protein [Candidatus Babeliales bacterium]
MRFMRKRKTLLTTWLLLVCSIANLMSLNQDLVQKRPKLTIIMVVDQFAHHYIQKLRPHLNHGIKMLLEQGVCYENACHPHAIPETCPGHSSLSTGTVPTYHGVTGNRWYNQDGKPVEFIEDEGRACSAEVFRDQETTYDDHQRSSSHIMVDAFADQFVLSSPQEKRNIAISLSIKSKAAMATANRMGKAIWFDDKTGRFTSSKHYYNKLPNWLEEFNEQKAPTKLENVRWETLYPRTSAAYDFPHIDNYDYAALDFPLISEKPIPIDRDNECPYDLYNKTPHSNQLLFDLAKKCIDSTIAPNAPNDMVMWLCLSSLDLLGHYYGPDSLEAIDMVYHLDQQIKEFMLYAQYKMGKSNVLFALTGDHGIQPIQELSYKKGITQAQRVMVQPLIEKMNEFIEEKYDLKNAVQTFESTYFVMNKQQMATKNTEEQAAILTDLKDMLLQEASIKRVWTRDELHKATFRTQDVESYYKNHLYDSRLGELIIMPQPYCLLTRYPKGCSHNTPYDYDTHVPLIVYQHGRFAPKTITQKVLIPQLPTTLSYLLGVVQPSAGTFPVLPGIFDEESP